MSDVQVIQHAVHQDNRGSFEELFNAAQLPFAVKQINSSISQKNVLRGLHWQPGQAKLVTCLRGAVLDIVLNLKTGKTESFLLYGKSGKSVLIPGTHYAHGFIALEEENELVYACSEIWDREKEISISMQDNVDRAWKKDVEYILSDKDKTAPSWSELKAKGLFNV